jgi:hypothetical protein
VELVDGQGAGRCVGSGEGLFLGGLMSEKDREDNNRRSSELLVASRLGQIDTKTKHMLINRSTKFDVLSACDRSDVHKIDIRK